MKKTSVSEPCGGDEKQTVQEENQSAANKVKTKPAVNKTENKPSTSKTQTKPSTSKIENKPLRSKIENKLGTSRTANKSAVDKIAPVKKLTQLEQNRKQTVTKKALPVQNGKNTKTNSLPTVKKNLSLLRRKDTEDSKLQVRKEKEVKISVKESKTLVTKRVKSVADGWPFVKPKYAVSRKDSQQSVRSKVHSDAEIYDMNHKRTGVAVIFNHTYFASMPNRSGSKKDANDLNEILRELRFDVRIHDDLLSKDILKTLEDIAAEDHTDADCLMVVVMSHGDSGLLYSYDNYYAVQSLWTNFIGGQCPTLAGKPKLFFIQACRGKKGDNPIGINVHETDSAPSYSIPEHADIMVAYSTYDGYFSFRNADAGSWFIQALCEELRENWRTHDLLRMMTSVIRRVAVGYISYVPYDEEKNRKKQIPSILTMLTRLVYFSDKSLQ